MQLGTVYDGWLVPWNTTCEYFTRPTKKKKKGCTNIWKCFLQWVQSTEVFFLLLLYQPFAHLRRIAVTLRHPLKTTVRILAWFMICQASFAGCDTHYPALTQQLKAPSFIFAFRQTLGSLKDVPKKTKHIVKASSISQSKHLLPDTHEISVSCRVWCTLLFPTLSLLVFL